MVVEACLPPSPNTGRSVLGINSGKCRCQLPGPQHRARNSSVTVRKLVPRQVDVSDANLNGTSSDRDDFNQLRCVPRKTKAGSVVSDNKGFGFRHVSLCIQHFPELQVLCVSMRYLSLFAVSPPPCVICRLTRLPAAQHLLHPFTLKVQAAAACVPSVLRIQHQTSGQSVTQSRHQHQNLA